MFKSGLLTRESPCKSKQVDSEFVRKRLRTRLRTYKIISNPTNTTVLISCKHSCRFSPLRNTGYAIHFRNLPPIKRQGNCVSPSTILHHCYTKCNFQSKSHSQKRDMLLTFTTPSTATFLHPSKCQSP